jgi:hypothetical protein
MKKRVKAVLLGVSDALVVSAEPRTWVCAEPGTAATELDGEFVGVG